VGVERRMEQLLRENLPLLGRISAGKWREIRPLKNSRENLGRRRSSFILERREP